MKKNKLLTLSMAALAVLSISSCKKDTSASDSYKIDTALRSTITKIDKLNKAISVYVPTASSNNVTKNNVSNEKVTSTYSNLTSYDYSKDQAFGIALFNNISYQLLRYYVKNQISLELPLYGYSLKLPTKELQDAYEKYEEEHLTSLPEPKLIMSCSVVGNEENYDICFDCDWDFRNTYFASTDGYKHLNSILTASGFIKCDKNGVIGIGMNHYWTGINRDMAAFYLSFSQDNINCTLISLDSDKTNPGWDYQKGSNTTTISTLWGSHNFNCQSLITNLYYHDMRVYQASLDSSSKFTLNSSKRRNVSKFGAEVSIEEGEGYSEFETVFNNVYSNLSSLKIRNEKELIEYDQTHNIQDAMKLGVIYSEAKGTTFWLYNEQQNKDRTYQRAINPFEYRTTLRDYINSLKKQEGVTEKQKALISRAVDHLNRLKDDEYFGVFTNNDDISFSYFYLGDKNSTRTNVYDVFKLYYLISDLKNPEVYVKFIIDNNKAEYDKEFGDLN